MVLQHDLWMETGLAHHMAVLRHCADVLRRRVKEDAAYAWLWKVKLKVALFGLRMLEGQQRSARAVRNVELEADEIDELAESHPLLQNDRPASSPDDSRKQTDWYRDLQERVQLFARG